MSEFTDLKMPNDPTQMRAIRYDNGHGETLTIYPSGGEAPMSPVKVKRAVEFRDVTLPRIVEELVLFRNGALDARAARDLARGMREQRDRVNAFERHARINGQAFYEHWCEAAEGVEASLFGDDRYKNNVAAFLRLVDRLFPQVYQAAADAALDKATAPAEVATSGKKG